MTQFGEAVTADVMARVVAYRKARKLSAAALAEGCTAAGHPISRAVLAGLENGRRVTLNLADVLAFAHVLEVPVLELIYGVDALDRPSPLALPVGAERAQADLLLHADGTWGDWSTTLTALREVVSYEADLVTMYESLGAERRSPDPQADRQHRELVRTTLRQVAAPTVQRRWALLLRQCSTPPIPPDVRKAYEFAGFHEVLRVFERAEAGEDPDRWTQDYEAAMDAVWGREED